MPELRFSLQEKGQDEGTEPLSPVQGGTYHRALFLY